MKACLFVATILLVACTKNTPDKVLAVAAYEQFQVTTANLTKTTKFLKREVTNITSNPSRKQVRTFSFDAGNRCTEIRIGIIDSSQVNPVFSLTQTITLNYSGASILPVSLASVRTALPNLVRTYYFKYNTKGLKTKDSVQVINILGEPAYRVINYVYDSGRVHTTPVLSGFTYDNVPFDTLSILQNGNIEKVVTRTKKTSDDQISTYQFTYDKFVNPYNQFNIANSLYFENSAIGLGYNVPKEMHYMGVTFNNMISWSSGSYVVTYQYLYDADKYPIRKEMFLPGTTTPYQVTFFEY